MKYLNYKICASFGIVLLGIMAVMLIPESAMASAPVLEFEPLKDDIFIKMIKRMFGTIIDLNNPHTTALTDIIIAWSSFVLIIGGGLVSYGLLLGTMNTAHQGEALGKKWNSMWVPIRTMVAFGAVLPMPATTVNGDLAGLSAVQGGIIQLVRMGSGMADSLWTYSAQQIALKGFTQPSVDSPKIREFVRSAFASAVCLEVVKRDGKHASSKNEQKTAMYKEAKVDKGQVTFIDTFKYYAGVIAKDAGDNEALKGECGTTTLVFKYKDSKKLQEKKMDNALNGRVSADERLARDQANLALKDLSSNKDRAKYSAHEIKVAAMVPNIIKNVSTSIEKSLKSLMEIAPAYVDMKKKGDEKIDQKYIDKYETAYSNIYETIIDASAKLAEASKVDPADINEITAGGWSTAGQFYWKLKSITNQANEVIKSIPLNSFTSPWTGVNGHIMEDSYVTAKGFEQDMNRFDLKIVKKKDSDFAKDARFLADVKNNMGLSSQKTEMNWFLAMLMNALYGDWNDSYASELKSDPVLMAKNLGDHLSNGVVAMWLLTAKVYSQVEAVDGEAKGVTGTAINYYSGIGALMQFASGIGKGILQTGMEFLATVTPILIPIAFLYSTIIPSMPYVLFLFAMVGYLIYFTEAMVAAPVWAIFHAHPDGEDFTGKFGANGYMIAFGLLIRPSMIIMGFVAGMFIVNNLGVFLYDTFFGSYQSMRSDSLNFLSYIFEIILYGMLLSYVIYKSFELTYELPKAITEWIGGQHKDLGESGSKQAFVGGAAGVGNSMQSAGQNKALRSSNEDKGNKKGGKKGGDNKLSPEEGETGVNPKPETKKVETPQTTSDTTKNK